MSQIDPRAPAQEEQEVGELQVAGEDDAAALQRGEAGGAGAGEKGGAGEKE